MIVNPQFFNYRLIIGSLIVTIAVLAVFSFSNYSSIEQEKQSIVEEKKLVESELSQMISRNDELTMTNTSLTSQIEDAREDTKIALDSLRLLNSDLSVITKYKKEVQRLESKNKTLSTTVSDLENSNVLLEDQVRETSDALIDAKNTNTLLSKLNTSLKTTIENAAVLKAMSIDASAYNTILGREMNTSKASKTDAIDVCLTLADNILTKPGKKDIYIQILDPKNNVFADKGVGRFGDSSLIYSAKTSVNYQNESLNICTSIGASKKEQPLVSGTYYVSAFHNGRKLATTEIYLK